MSGTPSPYPLPKGGGDQARCRPLVVSGGQAPLGPRPRPGEGAGHREALLHAGGGAGPREALVHGDGERSSSGAMSRRMSKTSSLISAAFMPGFDDADDGD